VSKGVQRDKYIDKYIAHVTIGRGRCTTRRNVCQSAQADVDPTISLAFTLDAHPGSYALPPGSRPTDQFSAKDWFAKGIGPNLGI